ncbi:hypothetical protein FRC12_018207, partial [Ceratobasidium sp. 428]
LKPFDTHSLPSLLAKLDMPVARLDEEHRRVKRPPRRSVERNGHRLEITSEVIVPRKP